MILVALASLCEGALAQSPLERSVTLARERRYAEARRMLEGVPEPAELKQRIAFHRLRAAVAAGLGQPADAASEMRKALDSAGAEPGLLMATALAEFQAAQFEAAVQHATAAVSVDPANEGYLATLAFELIRRQSFAPAIDALSAGLSRFPKSARLRTLLGIAQYASGEPEGAVVSLSGAIARDAAFEPAYRCMMQIVLQSSAAPEATVVTQLCAWNRTVCHALNLRLARVDRDVAMQAAAVAGLEQAAKTNDAVARCELARAREWAGRLEDARTEMEACVAADPAPQNNYRLGVIYQRLGLPELARKQMELRNRTLQGMSEQSAIGLRALESLR